MSSYIRYHLDFQEDEVAEEHPWNTAKETTDEALSDSEKNVDFIEKWKVVLKVILDLVTPFLVYSVSL